jgi:predicted enzyme related to lactoylglutathione lyase
MNIRHFGIQSKKIKESIRFYKKLGFKIIYDKVENWNNIDDFMGKIRVVKMQLGDDVLEITDLYECTNRAFWNRDVYYACHIAIGIDDIEKILKKINKNITPKLSPDKSAKVAFIDDPNGFEIELVEVLL